VPTSFDSGQIDTVLHPGPLLMAVPCIVGDRYHAQQASLAAEQDPHATDFEGERYYGNSDDFVYAHSALRVAKLFLLI